LCLTKIIALTGSRQATLIFLSSGPAGIRRPGCQSKGNSMSKGNKQHGNKEAKKPKQEKPKVSATADSTSGRTSPVIAGKKIK
jgi:hypothetical protein